MVVKLPQTVALADGAAVPVDHELIGSNVRQFVRTPGPAVCVPVRVAWSASSVLLAALNAARRSLVLVNETNEVLYYKFGTTASATDYTGYLLPGAERHFPEPCYTGRIDGIWTNQTGAGAGAAQVSECTT